MIDENVGRHWSRNRLLAAIPAIDRALLEPHAKFVELAQGQVLFEPEEDVVITHFPLTGTMAALIVVLEDGRTAEAASIGREGAIGGIISAGHKPAFTRAVYKSQVRRFGLRRLGSRSPNSTLRSCAISSIGTQTCCSRKSFNPSFAMHFTRCDSVLHDGC